ncbi:MAG: MarR family winged helix-turn-helix transcriptional regulator [Alphaproteobacteria bacterium]|nr:MarR family winged helix-turn-helix transcriptional regulator [Alphaproteobacteria bacterium]
MITDTYIWLERLSSLHRSLMRKAANAEGMQLVQIEILQYLAMCNRYSNTAQALSEYLGQTKGSISQSLKCLEEQNLVERKPCTEDGRIVRLYLTAKSKEIMKRIEKRLTPDIHDDEKTIAAFKSILKTWQRQKNQKGFGQCRSCRFNIDKGDGSFLCGLTDEPLKKAETMQICREHEFA